MAIIWITSAIAQKCVCYKNASTPLAFRTRRISCGVRSIREPTNRLHVDLLDLEPARKSGVSISTVEIDLTCARWSEVQT